MVFGVPLEQFGEDVCRPPVRSDERIFGKDVRRLLRLVRDALLNPSKRVGGYISTNFNSCRSLRPLGCRGLLFGKDQGQERPASGEVPQPSVWGPFAASDGRRFKRSHSAVVPSGIAIRATSGPAFFSPSLQIDPTAQISWMFGMRQLALGPCLKSRLNYRLI
jgi:hypothetical protein